MFVHGMETDVSNSPGTVICANPKVIGVCGCVREYERCWDNLALIEISLGKLQLKT